MKYLLLSVFLAGCTGCGEPYGCDSNVFGKGVGSYLPIDCSAVDFDSELAINLILGEARLPDPYGGYTVLFDENVLRHRMKHVHVAVHSVKTFTCGGAEVIGCTNVDHIALSKYGGALAHEMLHAYDEIGFMNTVDGMLAFPVENAKEQGHPDWDINGYYTADDDYAGQYEPFTND